MSDTKNQKPEATSQPQLSPFEQHLAQVLNNSRMVLVQSQAQGQELVRTAFENTISALMNVIVEQQTAFNNQKKLLADALHKINKLELEVKNSRK